MKGLKGLVVLVVISTFSLVFSIQAATVYVDNSTSYEISLNQRISISEHNLLFCYVAPNVVRSSFSGFESVTPFVISVKRDEKWVSIYSDVILQDEVFIKIKNGQRGPVVIIEKKC